MGDMKEVFDVMREHKKEQKLENKEAAMMWLHNNNVVYTVKNNGYHLVVDFKVDFYPTTGKWLSRETKNKGTGLISLAKELCI